MLNDLTDSPPRIEPWLLVVMTSTYTSNPPSNAAAFKSWLERTAPGSTTWQNCRYLVWGTGNTQWNAFLAFPRYVHGKLSELGATPLAEMGYGDVGSPGWERLHADWQGRVWPVLRDLSGARPTKAAAARAAAGAAAAGALTGTDSHTAMQRSLSGEDVAPRHASRATSITSIMRAMSFGRSRMLAPAILTNPVGIDTFEARVLECRELQAADSPKRTRHLAISLPPGAAYYIYRDEIERFTADGVLDHVHVATSRERPGRRDYVQDRIREQGALVWRLLTAGAYVYVCGAQPMRDAVRVAFAEVIAAHGSLSAEEAEAHLRELETTTRYRPDLWG